MISSSLCSNMWQKSEFWPPDSILNFNFNLHETFNFVTNCHLLHKCRKHILIYSHKFHKAPNIVYCIAIGCCEIDIYSKLPTHSDAVILPLQSLFISTKTPKILTFLHERCEKFRTHILHVKKINLSKSQTPFKAYV
jgi:hypothetical protein